MGDEVHYTRLRQDLVRAVARLCPRWMVDRRDDLVQTAVIRVMKIMGRRSESGEGNQPLSTSYLYKVAYSVLVDEIRRTGSTSRKRTWTRPWLPRRARSRVRSARRRRERSVGASRSASWR